MADGVDTQELHSILEETLKITKQNSQNISELAEIIKTNSEETKQAIRELATIIAQVNAKVA